jgi:hypothetical protein
MLEQFWNLATSVEKSFFESTVLQLGLGCVKLLYRLLVLMQLELEEWAPSKL